MTDELITMLAKNPGLRVISRTSAMQYKSAHRSLPAIAHELGVDGILEGSVGRFGNRMHINVQLVYAFNDSHIIAGQVGLTVSSPAGPERRISPVAHDAYLRARHFANIRGPALTKALEYYQQATAKEPSFALA